MSRIFVGRHRELGELAKVVTAARAGRGELVMIMGEAGIGKTELATTAVAGAELVSVAWGRAWELGASPPYWSWRQVLSALGESTDVLARVAGDDLEARFRLFEDVVAVLRRLAQVRPLVIVLDDVHAADASSVLLLHHVAGQLPTLAIAIIATLRETEAKQRADLAAAFARLQRARTLRLAPLEREDVARLVDDAAELDTIYEVSGGNPLFVGELLRAGPGHVPGTVREVIRQRVTQLPGAARETLDLAAAANSELAPGPTFAERALDELLQHGLVERMRSGRFRFAHPLIREVAYGEIEPARRAVLHKRLADAAIADDGDAATIAHHLLAAGPDALEGAIAYAIRAAMIALEALAWEDALALLEHARAIVEHAGCAERDHAQLLVALGIARIRAGAGRDGKRACREAAVIAERLGDSVLLGRAALAYGIEPSVGIVDPILVQMLEQTLQRMPDGDSALRARATARLAAAMQPSSDVEQPIVLAREAIAMARRIGDDRVLLDVLISAIAAMMDFADAAERAPLNHEAAMLATARGDRSHALRSHTRLAFDYVELGFAERADQHVDAVARIVDEMGLPHHRWLALMLRAMRAVMSGRFVDAERFVEHAKSLGDAGDGELARCLVIHRAGVLRAADRKAELAAHIPEFAAATSAHDDGAVWFVAISAAMLARAGKLDDVRAQLARVDWSGLGPYDAARAGFLAEAVVAIEDRSHARLLYDLMLPHRTRFACWGRWGMICEPPLARQLGLLASALDLHDEAVMHLEDALGATRGAGARPFVAQIANELADALDRRGAPDDARRANALAAEARAIAEELGMDCAIPRRVVEPQSVPTPRMQFELAREGDVWAIARAGNVVRIKDSRGMQLLARLIENAGRDVHVLDLVTPGASIDTGDAGELLDARAREAYRERIDDLEDQLADAEARGDLGRAERARDDLEALTAELARAVGLGGRSRRAASAVERARSAVQRRIKDAIKRIATADPALGAFLDVAVRTGTFCSYREPVWNEFPADITPRSR